MCQCKTKPEEPCLCFVKVADALQEWIPVLHFFGIQHLPLYSGNDYTALSDAGILSGSLSDSTNGAINIPC